jgi:hypothetical protein
LRGFRDLKIETIRAADAGRRGNTAVCGSVTKIPDVPKSNSALSLTSCPACPVLSAPGTSGKYESVPIRGSVPFRDPFTCPDHGTPLAVRSTLAWSTTRNAWHFWFSADAEGTTETQTRAAIEYKGPANIEVNSTSLLKTAP